MRWGSEADGGVREIEWADGLWSSCGPVPRVLGGCKRSGCNERTREFNQAHCISSVSIQQ